MRRYLNLFLQGGPVGLIYALRLQRIEQRMRRLRLYVQREKELHRTHMHAIQHEFDTLERTQQSLQVSAAMFRKHCRGEA